MKGQNNFAPIIYYSAIEETFAIISRGRKEN
jgi:hypothetical protein